MSALALVNYTPINSGLGDTAPVMSAKINATIVLVNTHDTEIISLNAQIATNNANVTSLTNTVNSYSTSITTALNNSAVASGAAATATTNVANLTTIVNGQVTSIATATSTANTALTTANSATTTATAAQTTASGLSTQVTAATTAANAASATATAAQTQANTATTNAATALSTANLAQTTANTASGGVTTLTGTVNGFQSQITANTNSATAAQTAANTATSQVATLTTTVNSYSTQITGAQTTATNAQNAATTATTNVSTLTTAVSNYSAQITAATNTANTANSTATTANTTANTANTNVNNLSTTVAGLGGAQQLIAVSAFAGVDKTGGTSSLTAWNNILAKAAANVAAGTPTTIVVDCPIYLAIGPNGANTLFHASNVNITGTPDGMIIVDQLAVPFYFFCNVSNITWKNVHVRYNQPLNGSYMTNQNVSSGWVSNAGAFQTQYLGGNSGYLHTVNNVTYAPGGSPIWNGPSGLTSFMHFRGATSNITFDGCTFDVPPNASPAAFVYTFAQYNPEWTPGLTVIGLQSIHTATYNSGTNLITVTTGSGTNNLLAVFTVGNTYPFYISGNTLPTGYTTSYTYVTIVNSNTFTYPAPGAAPAAYSGTGYFGTQSGIGPTGIASSSVPQNITWKNCFFDGLMMGHVQTGQVNFIGCIWDRYTDLQDGTTGTVTFNTAPTGNSATLAANWPYPTAQYWVTLSNNQMIGMNLTLGAKTATGFVDPFLGNATNVVTTMVFTAALASGATSGTLSGWTLGRGPFAVVFSNTNSDVRTVTVNSSSPYTTFTAAFTALTGAATATQTLTVTTAAASGNIGGVPAIGSSGYYLQPGPYSPPPHCIYMGSSSGTYPYANVQVKSCLDRSTRVFNVPLGRTLANSGPCNSFKCEIGRGSNVDDWTCYRPEGGLDLQAFGGTQGSSITNCKIYWNSGTNLTDFQNNVSTTILGAPVAGVPCFGLRMPGPLPYNNIKISNMLLVDSNPSPYQVGFLGTGQTPNTNLDISGITVMMQDWAGNNGKYPQIYMAGTNIKLDASLYFQSMSCSTSYIGYSPGTTIFNQNSDIYLKIYGFRTIPFNFAAPISGATSVTLSTASVPGGFPQATFPSYIGGRTLKCFFYDNSIRYVTFPASGSSPPYVATWTGQPTLGDGSSTTGNTAQGIFYSNYTQLKPRITLPLVQGHSATRVRIDDYANQWYADVTGNMSTETFCDDQLCIPLAGTSSFTTQISILSFMSLAALGMNTAVTFVNSGGGMTGYCIGWSGNINALMTNTSLALNVNNSQYTPYSLGNITNYIGTTRQLIITPFGGAAYNVATAYSVGAIVNLNGVTYTCATANTGQTPPNATYWTPTTVTFDGTGQIMISIRQQQIAIAT